MKTYNDKYQIPDGYSTVSLIYRTFRFMFRNRVKAITMNMDKLGDTYSLIFPGNRLIIITRDLSFIQHVLRDNHTNYRKSEFTTGKVGRLFGKGLLFSNGDFWLRQRRLIQPAFHAKRLQGLYEIMTGTIENSLADWPVGKNTDVYPLVYQMAFVIIVRSMFGGDLSPETMQLISTLFNKMQDHVVKDINHPFRKFSYLITRQDKINQRRSEKMREIIRSIIVQRRKEGEHTDLLDMLLGVRYEDTGEGMSEDQIIDEALVLLLAGHETTANTLSWLLSMVSREPEVLAKLKAVTEGTNIYDCVRNEYIIAVINEAMRLRPAAFMTDRLAVSDDQYGSWNYPKGTVVLSFFYGVHRHTDHWKDADAFLPERFIDGAGKLKKTPAFFPFGAGPRLCIGNSFAMAEMCFFVYSFFCQFTISSSGEIPVMVPLITLRPDKVVLDLQRS